MTLSIIALGISLLSFLVAAITLYVTYFYRGTIQATRPSILYLGHHTNDIERPKIYLRTMLFATAKRGVPIEHLYVEVARGETRQVFNVWIHGEHRIAHGGGLFVPHEGVVSHHHFLVPPDGSQFQFLPGSYKVDLYAGLLRGQRPLFLRRIEFQLTPTHSDHLRSAEAGVYFEWSPTAGDYQPDAQFRKPPKNEYLEALRTFEAESRVNDPLG